VVGHRLARAVGELVGLLGRVVVPVVHADTLGQIGKRVVRGRLVCYDIGNKTALYEFPVNICSIAQ
jgi:hypothetical protein